MIFGWPTDQRWQKLGDVHNEIWKYGETTVIQAKCSPAFRDPYSPRGEWKEKPHTIVYFTKDKRHTSPLQKYLFSGSGGLCIRHDCVLNWKQKRFLRPTESLDLLCLSFFSVRCSAECIMYGKCGETISMFRIKIYLHEWLTLTHSTCCGGDGMQ